MKYTSTRTPNAGIECEKCGKPSELRIRTEVTQKQLNQPFYYSRWYQCMNPNCTRTTFMKDEDKIFNKNERGNYFKNQEELDEQDSLFRSL